MGTTITMEAHKGEETTKEQWDKLTIHMETLFDDVETDKEFINCGIIYCPYRCAHIKEQLSEEIREELKGSGITINMWYEEREPDETETL